MERDGRLHTKIGMASRFREDSPVNELVMHKQKVMPGCGFPYADLPQAGRLRRSCMFVRFPPTISCVAKVAGRRVDLLLARSVPGPLESRKETLMLCASSQNMTIGPMEGEAIDVSGR